MPTVDLVVSTPISHSMRCRQVEAMFDVPAQQKQTLRWHGAVPLDERPWNVGLIVGPSGSGKSTLARALWPDRCAEALGWGASAVIDDFPPSVGITEIAEICQAVGFNTIPAWLRPFGVLSNGEQFRVTLARLLVEPRELTVVDEFTSVVDRQVAKIGAHAVQKHIRKHGRQFVAVSCHSDIIEWLNPDWMLEPATMTFAWRALQRRPLLECSVARVPHRAWRLFAPFHYMSAGLHRAAQCFALYVGDEPAAFCGVLYRPHQTVKNLWGISRVVTLPDYQGLGLAFALTDRIGAALKALGQQLHNYPAHPAYVRACDRSSNWRLHTPPGLSRRSTSLRQRRAGRDAGRDSSAPMLFGGRPNAVFSYAGPAMPDQAAARAFLAIPSLSRAT